MKILLNTTSFTNTKSLYYNRRTPSFRSLKDVAEDVGGSITGYSRLKELGEAKSEAQAWKAAMKMADYGNPVRHAAWSVAGAKGAAVGAIFGPAGATIGFIAAAVAANYACNKVRNKVLDKIAESFDDAE